jgi:hypothetical protein
MAGSPAEAVLVPHRGFAVRSWLIDQRFTRNGKPN